MIAKRVTDFDFTGAQAYGAGGPAQRGISAIKGGYC
jgi:hypothetical protein